MSIMEAVELISILVLAGLILHEKNHRSTFMSNTYQLAQSIIVLRQDLHVLSRDLETIKTENVGISRAVEDLSTEVGKLRDDFMDCNNAVKSTT